MRIGISERGKSEIETRDRKSGNRFLVKTNEKLEKSTESYSREKLFSKRRPDGIQVKEYYFQN